ncbi:MAG: PQQ-like beta-propeller repeat protein, partial [Desulfobacterales bacterium]|nr:PQQ-like beta-propeller repeat protein [Desulfobacterales bacterium]
MKNPLIFFALLLTMLSFLACTQPPIEEEAEAQINVYGIYPGPDNTYSILVSKSLYNQENYRYIDSLLFIQIDTAGNKIACPGFETEARPNLREFHLLDNGNIMIYGNMSSYYHSYSYSTWEYSPLGVLQWELEMGDRTNGIAPSQDGNLFIFGQDQSHGLDNNILYLKIELDGDTLWDYRIPTNHYNTSLSSGTPTSDNGCIAIGSIWLNNRSTDILVARIDIDGDTLWTGTYGGNSYDDVNFALELSDASILVVGALNVHDTTNADWRLNSGEQIYLIKLSANGDKLWTKAVGNTLRESPNAIIEASDGSLILLGTRSQSYAYLYDETMGWISKLSADGEEIWIQEFESKLPMGIRELPNGDFITVTSNLADNYYTNASNLNIIKLNSSGTLLWS